MGNCFENRNVAGWLVLVDLLRRMLIDWALINSFAMKNRVWPLENQAPDGAKSYMFCRVFLNFQS